MIHLIRNIIKYQLKFEYHIILYQYRSTSDGDNAKTVDFHYISLYIFISLMLSLDILCQQASDVGCISFCTTLSNDKSCTFVFQFSMLSSHNQLILDQTLAMQCV